MVFKHSGETVVMRLIINVFIMCYKYKKMQFRRNVNDKDQTSKIVKKRRS